MILMMLDFYLKYKVREKEIEVEGRKRGKDQNPAIVYEKYLKTIFSEMKIVGFLNVSLKSHTHY